ncbi:MAG TPA: PEGA domain-containing protein, partial [Candidatus Saccharimonadales bacterium]|nr:PEGA domain-containing protein [Candidatus Saccharimonadales bacterium]
MRRLLSALAIVVFFLIIGWLLLVYATGKRLTNGHLVGSGIIQVQVSPSSGAKVYLDNKYMDTGNTNIENLKAGNHTLKIDKEHYHVWQKEITVVEGKVTPVATTLFPVNPSLTAVTFDGVFSPKISPDGKKIVFGASTDGKEGLYVLELANRQLFFSGGNSQKQIVADTSSLEYSASDFSWSPDSAAVLSEVKNTQTATTEFFLLDQSQINSNPQNVTKSIDKLKSDWSAQTTAQNNAKLKNLGQGAVDLAKDAKSLLFSKDNSAVLIIKNDTSAIVYDTKPNPVPGVKPLITNLPEAKSYAWFQNGTKHILSVENNVINLMDTDGTNKTSIFTGDFDPSGVF